MTFQGLLKKNNVSDDFDNEDTPRCESPIDADRMRVLVKTNF